MLKSLLVMFKGFFIGGTMMVPGVSGGSMAMVLSIYDQLISSIANFKKSPLKNIVFLVKFCIGAFVGIALFSKFIITPLLEAFPIPVSFFFLGAILGATPIIYKAAGVKKFSLNLIIYPIIGVIVVLLVGIIPEGVFVPNDKFNIGDMLLQFVGGVLIAVGFILPGVSVSQLFLMFGLYETVITAINTFDFLPLIPLGVGGVIGSLLFAKFMDKAMSKYPEATYLVIFGFLLGSIPDIFPGVPSGFQIPVSILTFAAGFCFIYFLQLFESKK